MFELVGDFETTVGIRDSKNGLTLENYPSIESQSRPPKDFLVFSRAGAVYLQRIFLWGEIEISLSARGRPYRSYPEALALG